MADPWFFTMYHSKNSVGVGSNFSPELVLQHCFLSVPKQNFFVSMLWIRVGRFFNIFNRRQTEIRCTLEKRGK
jgi:hypothetical protein